MVSIHTPTKGVTCYQYLYQTPGRSFNPHTHEGCDYTLAVCIVAFQGFNPHTHEGCDLCASPKCAHRSGFNPHTHEGCDQALATVYGNFLVSIHTPTKGVTQLCVHR